MKTILLFLGVLLAFAHGAMAQDEVKLKTGMSDTLLFEDWSSGSFATNQWIIDTTTSVLWQITNDLGNPLPSATVNHPSWFLPFAFSLMSKQIQGTNKYTELRFDFYFADSTQIQAQGTAEIFDGTIWHTLVLLDLQAGPIPWTTYSADISDFSTNDFKIRFRFYGEGFGYAQLNIDNILVGSFPLGISEHQNSDFSIRPNPAHSNVDLILKNFENQNTQLSILDLTGKAVYSEDFIAGSKGFVRKVNIENLSKGIYFCKIRSNQQEFIRKLVVQ